MGVRRNAAIAQQLAQRGLEVHVITSRHTPERMEADPGVKVHHAAVVDYRTRTGNAKEGTGFRPSARAKRLAALVNFPALQNSFPSNLLLGEGALLYILSSVRKAAQLLSEDPSNWCVVSSFRPWADLQAAYILKRRFPQITWWCDWRDTPFELTHRNYYGLRAQRRVLAQLLTRTDLLTAVSAGVMHDLPIAGQAGRAVVYNGLSLPTE